MDRTTYWGYSLSWYNLAGERRNGEIKRKERGERKGQEEKEREREKKDKREKNILHPSKYILQTTKHCSGATIRGQALSQDHPFPPSVPSTIPPSTRESQSTAEDKTYTPGSIQSENIMGTLLLSSWWYYPIHSSPCWDMKDRKSVV